MKTIRLAEHEPTIVVDDPDDTQLTFGDIEALERVQRAVKIEAFRWVGKNQVKAVQFVGMLAAAGVRLEILPKIDDLGTGPTRSVLMRMIGIAWDIPVRDGEVTGHDYQNCDLLELLIGLFARRLQEQVRVGLSRAYCRHNDDLSRLRGKLDLTRQFTKLAASPQKLACRYDEFTADTALNRLLLCAVTLLRRQSIRADTQRLLNEIAAHFTDVQPESVSGVLSEHFTLDRVNRRWEILAKLARLLLASAYQTAHGGGREGIALLFDMNLLFESYVAALAGRVCSSLGFEVHSQGPMGCLARNESGTAFETWPDLHLKRGDIVVVVDTKWKRVDPTKDNFDIAQEDAYQMHGYAHVYKSRATILLYPHHRGFRSPSGEQTLAGEQARWRFESGGTDLILATIDLAKPDGFAESLRGLLASAEDIGALVS